MQRIDSLYMHSDITNIADAIGIQPVYRRAYCQHGKTREQFCNSCEGGYVDDTHAFANLPDVATDLDGESLFAETDDGSDVAYIPARFQAKVNRYFAQPAQTTTKGE